MELLRNLPLATAITVLVIVIATLAVDRLLVLALDRTLARARAAENEEAFESFLTRLRVVRRLGRLGLYLVGAAAIVSQFAWLRALSAGLWASAGLAGLVVGMAAKGPLGNAIAGVTLAFSQPFRVGDGITLRNEYGVVEDITLMYTLIRTVDNRRLVVPNDVLSSEILYNHSLIDPRILTTVRFYVGYGADLYAAIKAITDVTTASPSLMKAADPPSVTIGEAGTAAVRIDVTAWAENQKKAWDLQADVRRRGVEALGRLKALPTQLPLA